MEYAFSIIMLAFGGGILLYALFIRAEGFKAIPKNFSVKPKDPQRYANRFALLMALIGAAPFAAGLAGFVSVKLGVVVLICGIIGCCIAGAKASKIGEEMENGGQDDEQKTDRQ
jgi:hypothetical protein